MIFMDILREFGIASRENESKLNEILEKLEGWMGDLEGIKDTLKKNIETSDDLDYKKVKLMSDLIGRLSNMLELYGKYTGDLKNQSINMNVSLDYRDAMFAHLGLVNRVLTDSQKKELLDLARENGLLFIRDTNVSNKEVEILEVVKDGN